MSIWNRQGWKIMSVLLQTPGAKAHTDFSKTKVDKMLLGLTKVQLFLYGINQFEEQANVSLPFILLKNWVCRR
jgi:hypothetical protein